MATQLEEILHRQIDSIKVLKDTIKELQDQMAKMDVGTDEWKTSTEQLAAAQKQLSDIMNAGKSKSVGAVQELKNSIKEMRDSLVNMDASSQEFKDTCQKIYEAQNQLNTVMRAGKDANDAAADSIVGLEQQYKSLYNEYKAMSAAQRESLEGVEMARQLDNLSNKLNDVKKGVGNYKDNIGRYSDSIIEAFTKMGGSAAKLAGPLKIATGGVKGLNTALKANPIGVVVALIQGFIAIINKMKNAIKGNEELQMRWNEAMSVFQPILDKAKNAISALATSFVNFAEKLANAYAKLKEFGAGITDFLGITKGAKDRVKEQTAAYRELAKAQNELIKQTREYNELNAKDNNQIEKLMEEASETENLAEKKRLLNEAKDLQSQVDQRNIELAEENLRILQEEAKRTDNDTAAQEALSKALIDVENARATQSKNQRRFNREIKSATSGLKDYREEAKKLYEELNEYYKTDRQKIDEKYQKDYKLLVKYGQDTTLLTKKYNEDIRKIEDEAWNKRVEKMREAFEAERRIQTEILISSGLTAPEINYKNIHESFVKFRDEIHEELIKTMQLFSEETPESGKTLFDSLGLEEGLKNLKQAIEKANALGFELEFPPENAGKNLKEVLQNYGDYLDAYEDNLMKSSRDFEAELRISNELIRKQTLDMYDELMYTYTNGTGHNYTIKVMEDLRAELELEAQLIKNEVLGNEEWIGTEEKKIELISRYQDILEELREQDFELIEREHELMLQNMDDWYAWGDTAAGSINTVIGSIYSLIQAEMQDGRITEKEFEKKRRTLKAFEGIMLAVSLAQIAASTASGIQGVWEAYSRELVLNAETAVAAGPAAAAVKAALDTKSKTSAILRTASIATAGAANMAAAISGTISKVRSLNAQEFGGEETGVGLAANVAPISSEPYSYSRVLQTQEEYDEMNRPVWASIVDIENAMGKQIKIREESSF